MANAWPEKLTAACVRNSQIVCVSLLVVGMKAYGKEEYIALRMQLQR
jgi:hypothetical protein